MAYMTYTISDTGTNMHYYSINTESTDSASSRRLHKLVYNVGVDWDHRQDNDHYAKELPSMFDYY